MNLTQEPVRVLVRHQAPVVAAGLAVALGAHPWLDVLHDVDPLGNPDVVVADYDTGLRLVLEGAADPRRPARARVLIVADGDRETDVRTALDAGVYGYILVDCRLEDLTAGVLALGRGSRYLCSRIAGRIAESLTYDALTAREADVLLHMVRGCSNKMIARELGIALGTVKAHAKAVFGKLDVSTRLEAVAKATARGLVPSPSNRAPDLAPAPEPASRAMPARPVPRAVRGASAQESQHLVGEVVGVLEEEPVT